MSASTTSDVQRSEGTFTDSYGIVIHCTRWQPPHPRAAIQLAHGVGEHTGRYEHVGYALAGAGYDVWADDHRGHGRTGLEQHHGDHAQLGRLGPGGVTAATEAVHRFTGVIRDADPDLPLILMGHSWGSLMAQMILNQHVDEYDAAVLVGTAHRTLTHMNSGDLNKRFRAEGTTGVEWLSRDPSVARAFVEDPLCTQTPLAKLFGFTEGLKLFGRPAKDLARRRDIPILIAVGSDDPLGGETSVRFLAEDLRRRSGFGDVTVLVYPGARHELFNETNKDEVMGDLVTWLDARFAPPSVG